MASNELHAEIDWTTAIVEGGRLTVGYDGEPSQAWADRVEAVLDRIDGPDRRWAKVSVKRKRVRVTCIAPGSEDDLRFLLEGAVQQANADFAPDEQDGGGGGGDGERRSNADEAMTATFRSFAPND